MLLPSLFILITGCSGLSQKKEIVTPCIIRAYPTVGIEEIKAGEFDKAIEENSNRLKTAREPELRQELLFNLGLLYVHPRNPGRDLKAAKKYFALLISNYPDSPLAIEADIWIGIIDLIEKTREVDINIEKKKKLLK